MMKRRSKNETIDAGEQALPAFKRIAVTTALVKRKAFSRGAAVTLADLARDTGIAMNDLEWVLGTTAMQDFAILPAREVGDSPVSRERISGYYIESDARNLRHEARSLRASARHLDGRAREMEAVADAIEGCKPIWTCRPEWESEIVRRVTQAG